MFDLVPLLALMYSFFCGYSYLYTKCSDIVFNFYKVKICDLTIETRENIVANATYVPEVNDGLNYKVTILHPVQPDVFLPFPLPNVSKMRDGVGHEVLWSAELVIPYEGGQEVYHVIFTQVNLFYSVLLLTNIIMF